MIDHVQNWWRTCEPREQQLLVILAGLVGVFFLVFVLILPVQSARVQAQAALDRAKADLVAISRLGPLSGQADRAPFNRAVLVNVARAQDVKLTRVQPGEDATVAVWIDEAQTERLYGFFDALLSDYEASLDRVVISSDANGRLSAQFTVRSLTP